MDLRDKLIWIAVAALGAVAFGIVALTRGEPVNAAWLVTAAVCIYFIAFRFYALFIVRTALGVDPRRVTPAYRHNDGLDYVPTNRYVLFGHHFAAIAGAGPLVGPVLAAQMGYLPGTLWILAGVVFAGAVQDMVVLFFSTRRDGKSLGEMIRTEIGATAGGVVGVGIILICVILLAVLALVVVNALKGSPWGTFAVASTIPIALFMGVYSRFFRPGRIGEMSAIGAVLLLLALVFGKTVAETPALASAFTFQAWQLALLIIGYGFVASVLPVWLLLAPRDYLSTFLKVGTIVLLAIGIVIVRPDLEMPAVTKFIDGSGPVWAGSLFPFLFITIACGAVSGWHSLISSGTTPKMIENENQIRFIGYGAMLMESFVAMMAMVAASVIHPGVYFAMNSGAGLIGTDAAQAAQVISGWGFAVTPDMLTQVAHDVGEIDDPVAHRRRADARRRHGADSLGLPRRAGAGGHLVSFRHSVRGPVHPDDRRRRHARAALHAPGPHRRRDPGVPGDRIVDQQPDRLGARLRGLGLFPLSGGDRPVRRDLDAVAAVRRLEPDACGDRAHPLHGHLVQDEARALRLGYGRACGMADRLHGDGGDREGREPGPEDRLRRPCDALRRRRRLGQGARSGQDHRRDGSDRVERLCRRDARRDLRRHRPLHARLWRPRGAVGAQAIKGDDRRGRRRCGGGRMNESLTTRARFVCDMVAQTARLMVGVPDYPTYVAHREASHPGQPVMTYEEFFRERQTARYDVRKGRLRGCC